MDAAAVGLDEALHDREPEPGALGVRAAAVEGLEDPLAVGGRDPRPAVDDAHEQPSAAHPRPYRDRLPGAVAAGVLEQVRERALELRGVREDQREVAVDREPDPVGGQPGVGDRLAQQLLDRGPVAPRLGRAGLQPRQLDQLVDDPRQPGALARDAGRELGPLLRRRATATPAPPRRS